jgi:hypothetical protein
MDNKKFKKHFQVLVPVTDKGNVLIMEPGTNGIIILNINGQKVGVALKDLHDAADEVNILAKLYIPEKEPEPEMSESGIDLDINAVGYADEEEDL